MGFGVVLWGPKSGQKPPDLDADVELVEEVFCQVLLELEDRT